MKYKFNTIRFAELLEEEKLEYRATARMLGISDNGTVQRWKNGKIISTEHLINICNTFDINPAEFYLCDGNLLSVPVQQSTMEDDDLIQAKIAFLHERLEFEKERFMFQKQKNEYELKQMQRELYEIRNELKRECGNEFPQLHKQQIITASEESDK